MCCVGLSSHRNCTSVRVHVCLSVCAYTCVCTLNFIVSSTYCACMHTRMRVCVCMHACLCMQGAVHACLLAADAMGRSL